MIQISPKSDVFEFLTGATDPHAPLTWTPRDFWPISLFFSWKFTCMAQISLKSDIVEFLGGHLPPLAPPRGNLDLPKINLLIFSV